MNVDNTAIPVINTLVNRFARFCESKGVQTLLLSGSVARGDINSFNENNRIHVVGDLDMIVIDERCVHQDFVRELEQEARSCSESSLIYGYLWHLGVQYRTIIEFTNCYNLIEKKDLLRDCKIILGASSVLECLINEEDTKSMNDYLDIFYSRLYCNLHYWPSIVLFNKNIKPYLKIPSKLKIEALALASKTILMAEKLRPEIKNSSLEPINEEIVMCAIKSRNLCDFDYDPFDYFRNLEAWFVLLLNELPNIDNRIKRNISAISILCHLLIFTSCYKKIKHPTFILDISSLQQKLLKYRHRHFPIIARDEKNRIDFVEKRVLVSNQSAVYEFGFHHRIPIEFFLPTSQSQFHSFLAYLQQDELLDLLSQDCISKSLLSAVNEILE